jgi:hypothetical protein
VYEEFFVALEKNEAPKISRFLAQGFDANTLDGDGTPVLIYAMLNNADPCVELLLNAQGLLPDAQDPNQDTALMHAALRGKLLWVKKLLALGAEPNRAGWSPMHYAAMNNHVDILKVLLEHNAYIDSASQNATTPLMMAARAGAEQAVLFLLENGADPTTVSESGFNAAGYAFKVGRKELGEKLLLAARDFRVKYYNFKK